MLLATAGVAPVAVPSGDRPTRRRETEAWAATEHTIPGRRSCAAGAGRRAWSTSPAPSSAATVGRCTHWTPSHRAGPTARPSSSTPECAEALTRAGGRQVRQDPAQPVSGSWQRSLRDAPVPVMASWLQTISRLAESLLGRRGRTGGPRAGCAARARRTRRAARRPNTWIPDAGVAGAGGPPTSPAGWSAGFEVLADGVTDDIADLAVVLAGDLLDGLVSSSTRRSSRWEWPARPDREGRPGPGTSRNATLCVSVLINAPR